MRRRLTLTIETLTQLPSDDLASVGGAALAATGGCPFTFHVNECVSAVLCNGTGT